MSAAHSDALRQRSTSVAFGAKRTLIELRCPTGQRQPPAAETQARRGDGGDGLPDAPQTILLRYGLTATVPRHDHRLQTRKMVACESAHCRRKSKATCLQQDSKEWTMIFKIIVFVAAAIPIFLFVRSTFFRRPTRINEGFKEFKKQSDLKPIPVKVARSLHA
jgi:hypothetical protein